MKEDFHKRLAALKTADAINAINGVPVSADAKFLSEKWVGGELTGGQGFPELFPEDGFIPPQSFLPLLSSLPRQSHHLSKIHTIYIDMIIIT